MTDLDIDAIRKRAGQVRFRTCEPGTDHEAYELARDAQTLLAKVDELTAALAKSREQAATFANEIGTLTAENARLRQQRDGLIADLTDAGNEVDLLTAENGRLRTALLDVAKTSGTTHVWDHQATDWVPVTKYAAQKAEATR